MAQYDLVRFSVGWVGLVGLVGTWHWVPDTRYPVPNTCIAYQVPGTCTGYQVPGTGYQVAATWYLVPVASYQIPGTWNQVSATWYQVPPTRYLADTAYLVPGTWELCGVPGTGYQVTGTGN